MAVDKAREIFETHMPQRFEERPELASQVNATYKFVLTGEEQATWHVDLTRPPGLVAEKDAPAQCTITVASKDFLDIVNGRVSGQMAFMTGKLKVAGDVGLALKLGTILGR